LSGYLVTRPYQGSNVGSNLASLCGALWVADKIGRSVVVDWRGLSQLQDPELNYFSEFFATPARMLGVDVAYATTGEDYTPESGAAWLAPGDAKALALGHAEAPTGTIVLDRYHGLDRLHPGPEGARFRVLRAFYRSLAPAPEIGAAIDAWAQENLPAAFVVGLNVRTGNGHYFGKGNEYPGRVDISLFEDRSRFLRVLERACLARVRALPKQLRDDFAIFYATDSASMSELLGTLPNAVTRRTTFPPPGSGDLFAFPAEGDYTDRNSIVDTLADMFLLARCDAFVFNSSMFNQYARVMTGSFGGNLVHIETLFLRKRLRHMRGRIGRHLPF
jgi:hypothetical protein